MHGRLRRSLFPYCSIIICSGSKYKNAEKYLMHFSIVLMATSKYAEG